MLQAMRGFGGGIILKVFVFFIVISFVVWGVADFLHSSMSDNEVAKIGDVSVSNARLSEEVRRQSAQIRKMFGGNVPDEMIKAMNVEGMILRQMVQEALLRQEAARLKFVVDDGIVTQVIAKNQNFRNEQGQFDRERFRQAMWNQGQSEEQYIASLKDNISVMFMLQALTSASVVPEARLQFAHAFGAERRVADYIVLTPQSISVPAVPDATALATYYEGQKDRFALPERRDVSYIAFSKKDVSAASEVGDAQLKAEYDARASEYTHGETREVEQMLFEIEEKADDAAALLKSGKSFAEVAKKSGFSEKQVAIGRVERKEMMDEIADKVFTLKEGGNSDVVKSEAGFHLFHVKKIYAPEVVPFEKVKEVLRKEMQTGSSSEALYALATKVEDELAGGASLEEIGKKLDLPVKTAKGLEAGKAAKDLPDPEAFQKLAFTTDQGNESALTTAEDQSSYYVLRVDNIVPQTAQPLEVVKAGVVKSWKEAEQENRLKKLAGELADRLEKGEALSAVAASAKLSVKRSDAVTRAEGKALPAEFVHQLFQVKKGAVPGVYQAADGSYVLGALAQVQAAPTLDKKDEAGLRQQAEEGFFDDILGQYTLHLQQRYPVRVKLPPKEAQ